MSVIHNSQRHASRVTTTQDAGLPAFINDRSAYVTDDCIQP
jgi:hypothetical protein